jgi:hypothetical protein
LGAWSWCDLNQGRVGAGRALKCVYNISSVIRALGRGHRVFGAALPRSGVPCAPPPCYAVATWTDQPVPPHCAICRCPLSLPLTRLHPIASLTCRLALLVPLDTIRGHCSELTVTIRARRTRPSGLIGCTRVHVCAATDQLSPRLNPLARLCAPSPVRLGQSSVPPPGGSASSRLLGLFARTSKRRRDAH